MNAGRVLWLAIAKDLRGIYDAGFSTSVDLYLGQQEYERVMRYLFAKWQKPEPDYGAFRMWYKANRRERMNIRVLWLEPGQLPHDATVLT